MNKHCDLHLHLGGSISKNLLIEFAQSDHNQKALDDIEEADVLHMFNVVHDLVNSIERVEVATENTIKTSSADYMEIRTTPRKFSSTLSYRHYVTAFAAGLRKYPEKAKGLLSIDRYKHDVKTAQEIISLALEFSDFIVGVDVSGVDPKGTRLLQGNDFGLIIDIILSSPLGLALHIGESDCEKERRDSSIALTAIDQWFERNQTIAPAGKIRLGHAINIEEKYKRIIRKHQLPIEICPSCHRYIGCWRKGRDHPVQDIYPDKDSPVVLGTDDALNFSTDFQREKDLFLKMLPYELKNAWNYRFGQFGGYNE